MSNRIQSNTHSFLIEDAKNHGIDKAVLLYNIRFWLQREYDNINKGAKIHDGYVWTFNSAQAYAKQFPYFSPKKIARLLKELESDGVLITGNYNKSSYDRTKWYTMPAYKVSDAAISQKWEMESPPVRNQIPKNEQPIPNINTNINNNNKKSIAQKRKSPTYSDQFLSFWSKYPRKKDKLKCWSIFKNLSDEDQLLATEGAEAYSDYINQLQKAKDSGADVLVPQFKYPQGWLTGRRWEDEHEEVKTPQRGNTAASNHNLETLTGKDAWGINEDGSF